MSKDSAAATNAAEGATSGELTLAHKLERLFATMHPKDRGPFTLREVADQVTEAGVPISFSYLSQLKTGKKLNPSAKQLAALADFFGVPLAYFVGSGAEVEQIDAQIAVVVAMQDAGVRDLALRASNLSPAGLRALANVLEGLEDVPGMKAQRGRSQPGGGQA